MVWSSSKTNCPSLWGPMLASIHAADVSLSKAVNLCKLFQGLCLIADTDLWSEKTTDCNCRGQKRKTTVWMAFEGPQLRSAQFWRRREADYFQAWHWCQMRVHECIVVTPPRRELISPGGISQDVKYVSWYLCRATLNGFTYRNSQWDGDSLQCLPNFMPHKRSHRHKKQNDWGCHLLPLKHEGHVR